MVDDPDPAAPLFAVPPGAFVAERDRVAAALKKAGQKEEAAAIKALPKPPASAWAVNQLARLHPEAMSRFLDASADVRRAQTAGATDEARQAYHAGLAAQKQAFERLLALAAPVLEEAGLGAARATLDRVANDLRWGAVADDTRALLARGRLLRDLEPPDLAALAGGGATERPSAPAPARPAAPAPPRPQGKQAEGARRKSEEERRAAEEARRAAQQRAREEQRALQIRLAAAQKQAALARAEAQQARLRHGRAEARLAELRAQLEKAAAEAEDSGRARAAADQAVERTEREVESEQAALAAAERAR